MNTLVSFKLAKLLKEKGYDRPTLLCYDKCDILSSYVETVFKPKNYNTSGYVKSAPTIADVVMWLYEKHGIWIGVELIDNTREFYFQPTIWTSKDRDYHDEDMIDQAKSICKWKEWRYNSPTEAYEASIEHLLNEII